MIKLFILTCISIVFVSTSLADSTSPRPFYANEKHSNEFSFEDLNEEFAVYTIQKTDTLMLISFYAYNNYAKWKEILTDNNDVLTSYQKLPIGTKIKIRKPLNAYRPPRGRPYLIQNGDTLRLISKKVYGQMKLWRHIYANNQNMIQNPNLIFAGLTLYYKSDYIKEKLSEQATQESPLTEMLY